MYTTSKKIYSSNKSYNFYRSPCRKTHITSMKTVSEYASFMCTTFHTDKCMPNKHHYHLLNRDSVTEVKIYRFIKDMPHTPIKKNDALWIILGPHESKIAL